MRAAYFDGTKTDTLVIGELPEPEPGDDEVLVRVHASTVMPTERQWFPTFHTSTGAGRAFPIVLGHEFSGVIRSKGNNVSNVKPGEPVFGLNDWFTNGAHADYCLCPASSVAKKPRSLDHAHAAVVPISGLTAWQALYEKAKLTAGERILVHGAAGSVGSFAVQLARRAGAEVIATASTRNIGFVRSLGANQVIDYEAERFEERARNIDVVFDVVGGETLSRSWPLLSSRGRIVTVATVSAASTDSRIRDAFLLVRADGSQLGALAELIDAGELKVHLAGTFPLELANEAFAAANKMRGKIALCVHH